MSHEDEYEDEDSAGGSAVPGDDDSRSASEDPNDSGQGSAQPMSTSSSTASQEGTSTSTRYLIARPWHSSRGRGNRTNTGRRAPTTSVSSVACQTDQHEQFPPMAGNNSDEDAGSSANDNTLRLMIQNFRNMADTVRGPSKRIQGVSWRIMVMPRQHVVQKKGTQKCLGFFLQCCPDAYSDSWSCQAAAELRLISQKPGVPHFTRKTNHIYTSKENDWGYSCFMTWSDILDDAQGYIKEDRIILEVSVKAEEPKNILSHDEFCKRISSWQELADMQYKKGLIDLAIEANAQALKFCKDRDLQCKGRLEIQKKFFIECKLMESITRIEKNKKKGVVEGGEEETVSSQTALKLALTSTNTTKMNGHGKKDRNHKKDKRHQRAATPPGPGLKSAKTNTVQTEQASTVRNFDFDHHLKHGEFNSALLGSLPVYNDWHKRSQKEEDEMYTILAKQLELAFQESLQGGMLDLSMLKTKQDKENFILKYMNEQMRHLALVSNDDRRNWFSLKQLRTFAENAFDLEVQRQDIVVKAGQMALEYTNRPDKTVAKHAPKQFQIQVDFDKMFSNEELKARREGIVDREAKFLDAKIRMFWNEEVQTSAWGTDRSSDQQPDDEAVYSDSDASDSDRQNDGSIRAKRTKREHDPDDEDDNPEEEETAAPTIPIERCDIGMQTEETPGLSSVIEAVTMTINTATNATNTTVAATNTTTTSTTTTDLTNTTSTEEKTPQNAKKTNVAQVGPPGARVVKKAMGTKAKKAAAAAAANQAAQPTTPIADSPQSPDPPSSPVSSTNSLATTVSPTPQSPSKLEDSKPIVIPLETKKEIIAELKKGAPASKAVAAKKPENSTSLASTSDPLDTLPVDLQESLMEFPGAEQMVLTALSTVAMNLVNTKRVSRKVDEILGVMITQQTTSKAKKLIKELCKLAGHQYTENDRPPQMPRSVPPPDKTEMALFAVYEKITSRDDDSEYMLVQQAKNLEKQAMNRLELAKSDMGRFTIFGDAENVAIMEAVQAIGEKFVEFVKTNKELNKLCDEWESKFKKYEKQYKAENKNLHSQLQNEKEKNANISKDKADRAKELKKLENKIATMNAESADLQEKLKLLQKELTATQKKTTDDLTKARRENAQLVESKKHLQAELSTRDAENKALSSQLEEKNDELQKLKDELEKERQKSSAANQAMLAAMERGKKSEAGLLQQQLDIGLQLLERAKEDATKNVIEMDNAIADRSRSTHEVAQCLASRNEWTSIIEELKRLIATTGTDFKAQIDAILNGNKTIATLPRLIVPKPPPPPAIHKAAPIAPVEPTKPLPGVIGSRPQHVSSVNVGSNLSPNSRAPCSPIQKPMPPVPNPVPTAAAPPAPISPVRMPAPIGTRPTSSNNNIGALGVSSSGSSSALGGLLSGSSDLQSSSSSTLNNLSSSNNPFSLGSLNSPWSWSDSLSNLTESIHSNKRTFGPLTGNLAKPRSSSPAFSRSSLSSTTDQNGWDDANKQWTNNAPMSSLGSSLLASSSSSFLSQIANAGASSSQQHPQPSQQHSSYGHHMPQQQHPQAHLTPSMSSYQQQQQQQQQWIQHQEQQQYIYRLQQTAVPKIVKRVCEMLRMDQDQSFELVVEYCNLHKHSITSWDPEEIADGIRNYYAKKLAARHVVPPGAAPGYMLQNPLLNQVNDRPSPFGGVMDQHLVNGDARNGLPPSDKWSNGL